MTRKYYMALVNGKEALIISDILDIAELDSSTVYKTKEEYLTELEYVWNIAVPENSEVLIFQVKRGKDKKEYLEFYDPVFLLESGKPLQSKLEEIFPTFVHERVQALHKNQKVGEMKNAKSVKILEKDGEEKNYNYKDFIYLIVKSLVSNTQEKNAFKNRATTLSKSITKILEAPNPLDPFHFNQLLKELNNYKVLRAFYLEYIDLHNPSKVIIDRNKKRYFGNIIKELYILHKNPTQYYENIKRKNINEINPSDNEEMSEEERNERLEYLKYR